MFATWYTRMCNNILSPQYEKEEPPTTIYLPISWTFLSASDDDADDDESTAATDSGASVERRCCWCCSTMTPPLPCNLTVAADTKCDCRQGALMARQNTRLHHSHKAMLIATYTQHTHTHSVRHNHSTTIGIPQQERNKKDLQNYYRNKRRDARESYDERTSKMLILKCGVRCICERDGFA